MQIPPLFVFLQKLPFLPKDCYEKGFLKTEDHKSMQQLERRKTEERRERRRGGKERSKGGEG